MTAVAVLTIDAIPRSTFASWYLDRAVAVERVNRQGGRSDIVACSRTAVASLYRYQDPGHPADGTWCFWIEERRHRPSDLTGESYPQGLLGRDDEVDYATWRECFDAALAAVRELRGCS